MAYKTIAVYVDDSKHCRARIDAAAILARRFDAHLVGIYATEPIPSPHALQDPCLAERLAARSSAASQRMALAKELFDIGVGEIDSARREFRDVVPAVGLTRKFVSRNVGFPLKFDNRYSKLDL